MGVDIDEAGSHNQPSGIDGLPASEGFTGGDGSDSAIANAEVGPEARSTGAIYDGAVGDGQVKVQDCTSSEAGGPLSYQNDSCPGGGDKSRPVTPSSRTARPCSQARFSRASAAR